MTSDHFKGKNIAIIGAGGALGRAFIDLLQPSAAHITAFSRTRHSFSAANMSHHLLDVHDEEDIAQGVKRAVKHGALDVVLVAIGTLHGEGYKPEKSYREFSASTFKMLFEVNTIAPAILAKHYMPHMRQDGEAIFAAISARIGSISDNRMGGWTSYRASKAALNMVLKNLSIEQARKNKKAIIVGLHPGTVDTALSKPYQGGVPAEKLFTPSYAAQKMLDVLAGLTPDCSGKIFAWDGEEITP